MATNVWSYHSHCRHEQCERPALGSEHPRFLIPELCRQFYQLGWVSGTGGGISIKTIENEEERIYIAPSGVQKERLQPEDLFICDMKGNIVDHPTRKELKLSQCAPLFMLAYELRGAGAVIHSHSEAAFMATVVFPGKEFRVTHMEMIKGISNDKTGKKMRYDDELIVPIIENTPFETDLTDSLRNAMIEYPESSAVLVRRHGIYIWGHNWQRAKSECESYDYLFQIALQMKKHGLDPSKKPE
eukprot:gene9960-10980_t